MGDLCHEPTPENYDRLFATLDDVNIPFIAIPGNHDVTLSWIIIYLCPAPSFPVKADTRLQNCYSIATGYWDLLLLDSSCEGAQSWAKLTSRHCWWLAQQLANANRPCAIFFHHPMVLIDSTWLDEYTPINADRFWKW